MIIVAEQHVQGWLLFTKLISPGQNGRHFADDIFRCIFMNESFIFCLKFHWSLFLRVQMTITQHWFRFGAKPLSELMLTQFIYAALGGDELRATVCLLRSNPILVSMCYICVLMWYCCDQNMHEAQAGYICLTVYPRIIDESHYEVSIFG